MNAHVMPEPVAHYLQRLREHQDRPVCLHLDESYRLIDAWGDEQAHGLSSLEPGVDVRLAAPYLDHLDPQDVTVVPFVNTSAEAAVHIHAMPASDGWFVLLTSATRELQQQRGVQQNANEMGLLAGQQRRLLDELVEAKTELEIRRDQVEEADRLKGRFIAGLSHELRTPLSAVMGYARLIAQEVEGRGEAGQHAVSIGRCAEHLLGLVEQVLDQAQLESMEVGMRIVDADVLELLRDLTSILAPLAADKGLAFAAHVEPGLPERVLLDTVRVRQVLINLLGNAVKFTERGSVRVDAAWCDGMLTFAVADTGRGIAPEDQARIFQAFARTEGDTVSGAGLGLAITRRIVERMGGEITLDSEPGRGSRFEVHVPAAAANTAESERRPAAAHVLTAVNPARIVVAEDDEDLQLLLRHFLEDDGFAPVFASRASAALERVLEEPPGLVLIDLHLEGSDGADLARELRQSGFRGPILALSASETPADRARALEAGCDEFMSKPFDPPALLATAHRLARAS